MINKNNHNSKKQNFKEIELDIAKTIRERGDLYKGDSLSYKVCISALALVLKQTNDKKSMMDYVYSKINNEATIIFLEAVEKEYSQYIEELSKKHDKETLKSIVLFSTPDRPTGADMNYIPEGLSTLVKDLLELKREDIVLNLGSGLNAFLMDVAQSTEVKALYGVEIDTENIVIVSIRSFIAEVSIEVIQGNIVAKDFNGLSANKVFFNYPIGMKFSDLQVYIDKNPILQKYIRDSKGTISRDWIYNMAAYLNTKQPGRTVALMTSAGTWSKADEELRKILIEKGVVEGVILLPEGLLATTIVSLTIMIFSQNNDEVRMVDASETFTEWGRQYSLDSIDILEILEAYNNDTRVSRRVKYSEIAKEEYILNPQRYLDIDVGIKDGIELGELILSINYGAMMESIELDELSSIYETNYKYLTVENIKNKIIGSYLPSLIEIEDKYKRYCAKNNNLVISKWAPFEIGMVYVKDGEEILVTGDMYSIELDNSKVNPVFVGAFLQSEIGMALINRYAEGSNLDSISIKDLERIPIPNLSREKQDEIAEEFDNLCVELSILYAQEDIIGYMKRNIFEGIIR